MSYSAMDERSPGNLARTRWRKTATGIRTVNALGRKPPAPQAPKFFRDLQTSANLGGAAPLERTSSSEDATADEASS